MFQRTVLLVSCLVATGCASVMNETTHPMKVETRTETGELVTGADCTLTNDRGSMSVKSGDIAQVRRSIIDVDIVCKHPSNRDAIARAISRANAGLFGNIIIGGGIGAIIDHNRGTAYTYPTWVQLVFGQMLVFDRSDERDGQPAPSNQSGVPTQASVSPGRDMAHQRQTEPGVTMDDLNGLLPPVR